MKAERDTSLVMDALLHHSDKGSRYTRDQARADVFDCERFDNPRRRHSKLGYLRAMEFEARAMPA